MNKILLPLTAVALCFCTSQAMAATDSDSGVAKAKIIAPLDVDAHTDTDGVNFGTLLAGANGVTIPTSSDTRTGCGDMCVTDSNTPSRGVVDISHGSDLAGVEVSVTLTPPANLALTSDNTKTIPLTSLTTSLTDNKITLSNASKDTFYVGGTLGDTTNATSGDYQGTYTVTVNY